MESSKNILPKNAPLKDILKILKAYIENVSNHSRYLEKIANGEISEDEAKKYFEDIYGFKINFKIQNSHFFDNIKIYVDIRIKYFFQYLEREIEILENDEAEESAKKQAFCTLKMILTHLHQAESESLQVIKPQNALNNKFLTRLHKISHDEVFMKSLLRGLEPHVPEEYKELEKIIKLKSNAYKANANIGLGVSYTVEVQWKRFKEVKAKEMQQIAIEINGKQKTQEIQDEVKKDPNKFLQQGDQYVANAKDNYIKERDEIKKEGTGEISAATKYQIDLSATTQNYLKAIKMLDSYALSMGQSKDEMGLIKENIRRFFECYRGLENYKKCLERQLELTKRSTFVNKKADLALATEKKLQMKLDIIEKLMQSVTDKAIIKNLEQDLQKLKTKFVDVINQRDTDLPPDLIFYTLELSEDELSHFFADFQNGAKLIDQQADLLKTELGEILKSARAEKEKQEQEKNKAEAEFIHKQNEENKKIREQQLEDSKKRIEDYRKQVEIERQVREEKKQKDRDEINNKLKEKVEKEKTEKPNVILIDEEMESIVLNLNQDYFNVLENIVNLKYGTVKYQEAVNLITSQLKGTVSELSKGSSHKTISLNKIIKIVSINEDDVMTVDSNSNLSKNDMTKQQMWKQHGKQKTERTLCEINHGYFQHAFIEAGFTKEMVARISKKRDELKIAEQQKNNQVVEQKFDLKM